MNEPLKNFTNVQGNSFDKTKYVRNVPKELHNKSFAKKLNSAINLTNIFYPMKLIFKDLSI